MNDSFDSDDGTVSRRPRGPNKPKSFAKKMSEVVEAVDDMTDEERVKMGSVLRASFPGMFPKKGTQEG